MEPAKPHERTLAGRIKVGASVLGHALGHVVMAVGEVIDGFNEIVHAAESIARRYRWCISTSWPPNLIIALGDMAKRGAPYHEFESRIMQFYRDDDWHELERLVDATCKYDSVSPLRRVLLRDTVSLLRAGERDGFNAASFAVPTLFAQLEGMLRDYGREDLDLVEGQAKKTITIKDVTPTLRCAAEPVERPSIDVITNLLYRSYRSKTPPRGHRFNRHLFNHGRALEPGKASYVVRLLLMIDQMAYLIDKARGIENNAVQFRRSWSQILSASSINRTPWRGNESQVEERPWR